jgi:hypothetical protein
LRVVESGFRELHGSAEENPKDAEEHRQGWELELGQLREYVSTHPCAGIGPTMRGPAGEVDELLAAVADPTRRQLSTSCWTRGKRRLPCSPAGCR